MPTDKEIYWEGQLMAPLGARTERERRTARRRTCRTCEGILFIEDPERVSSPPSYIGHDSDCDSLRIAIGGFGGSAPSSVTLARTDIFLSDASITLATLND